MRRTSPPSLTLTAPSPFPLQILSLVLGSLAQGSLWRSLGACFSRRRPCPSASSAPGADPPSLRRAIIVLATPADTACISVLATMCRSVCFQPSVRARELFSRSLAASAVNSAVNNMHALLISCPCDSGFPLSSPLQVHLALNLIGFVFTIAAFGLIYDFKQKHGVTAPRAVCECARNQKRNERGRGRTKRRGGSGAERQIACFVYLSNASQVVSSRIRIRRICRRGPLCDSARQARPLRLHPLLVPASQRPPAAAPAQGWVGAHHYPPSLGVFPQGFRAISRVLGHLRCAHGCARFSCVILPPSLSLS